MTKQTQSTNSKARKRINESLGRQKIDLRRRTTKNLKENRSSNRDNKKLEIDIEVHEGL